MYKKQAGDNFEKRSSQKVRHCSSVGQEEKVWELSNTSLKTPYWHIKKKMVRKCYNLLIGKWSLLSSLRYKSCLYHYESNASYFITFTHDIRGEWWYGSRGWTFLTLLCYMLLPCDRWQQRGSLTEWHLTWKCMWSKGVALNSSMWKKWHPLTVLDTCWTFTMTKQWMWSQWGSRCFVSTVAMVTVGHLQWCRWLWPWHTDSCSLLGNMQC